MSLEKRIKQFAEQARSYLLQEFARSLQQDATVVQWQGFDEDGKLIVKNKDLFSTVDGVGQKYTTKGSDLILDNIGSVEQKKSREKEELALEKKLIPIPPRQFVPRSAIIIFPEFGGEEIELIIGWVMIYFSRRNIYSTSAATSAFCDALFYPNRIFDSNTTSHINVRPTTYGTCLRVSVAYAWAETLSLGNNHYSASALASLGNLVAEVNLTSSGSYTSDYSLSYAIEETSNNQNGSCQTQTAYNIFGNAHGNADARAQTMFFQFVNAKIYIQYVSDEEGNTNVLNVDLNEYVDYTVKTFRMARNYAKYENDTTVLYHTYSVMHVDTSYEFAPIINSRSDNEIRFGKLYRGILHLKTNLSTGATTSKYTEIPTDPDQNYLGYILYNSGGGIFLIDAGFTDYWDFYSHPAAIWQNSFEGDWINEFSEIAYDEVAEVNLASTELYSFLKISWDANAGDSGLWQSGLHGEAPSYTFRVAHNYDPATTANQRWLNGQPYYNTYEDIENLGYAVNYGNHKVTTVLPDDDDFVEIDRVTLGSVYGPNYPLEIDNTETNYNDRIYGVYLSYLPPVEVEDEGEGEGEGENP